MQRFRTIVGLHFSPQIAKADEDLAARARMEPLTELEHSLLRVEGPSIEELEKPPRERHERHRDGSASRDVDEVDVVDLLIATARRERARKAWQEIDGAFTPRERAMLVVWARQEGTLRRMPVQLIATRSTDN
jgi:hypothetical protein